jgi:hypothetical protein
MHHFRTALSNSSELYIVARLKAGFTHVGIQLPDGRVAHCAPGRGEHISTAEEFAMSQDVTTIEIIPQHLRAATLARIAQSMRAPKDYHVAKNNCEMFVNRMLDRKETSPQLNATLIIAGILLFGFAAAA